MKTKSTPLSDLPSSLARSTGLWSDFGFMRVSAILPKIQLGQPLPNAEAISKLFQDQVKQGASVVVGPELGLTGYTCEDLFHSEKLLQEAEQGIEVLRKSSEGVSGILVVGAPLRLYDGRLLNSAWVIHSGKIAGVVPKSSLPNMGEFYERRWFISGKSVDQLVEPRGEFSHWGKFRVSPNQIFEWGKLRLGIEICQDLWTPLVPSEGQCLQGANVILNLSASNEIVAKKNYRKDLVRVQSRRGHCGYVYVGAGSYESSKDTVFGGHTFGYELGALVNEAQPFHGEIAIPFDFDLERILQSRSKDTCFLEAVEEIAEVDARLFNTKTQAVEITQHPRIQTLTREVSAYPFLDEIDDYEEVIQIQSQGLLRRAQSARSEALVIGISGGLDSTLALYIALRAKAFSGNQIKVIGVTLPGPGTSERTLELSRTLLKESGVDEIREISISESVALHLKDLGKADTDRSVVYENAQARERTQVLFNLANEYRGIVVGTGDLSELALGWCTFNADQMAHYAVNAGIPKTVVKGLVGYWSDLATTRILKTTLLKILSLPISPELLPPSDTGEIAQETEAVIGSYDLHDFFIYHFLNSGFSQEKIRALAEVAFEAESELKEQLPRAIDVFFGRFFKQQFKRTTLPPGPKVHSVSLSPRSDFRLPDEI